MAPLEELGTEFEKAQKDSAFQHELQEMRWDFTGRPTPLYCAAQLTGQLGGAKIYLCEDPSLPRRLTD